MHNICRKVANEKNTTEVEISRFMNEEEKSTREKKEKEKISGNLEFKITIFLEAKLAKKLQKSRQ